VVVIGATNRPNLIEPALLRPGRFDELVYVGVPDAAGRERILKIQTAKMPLASDVDLKSIAEQTQRYTGADLEDVVRRAGLVALRQSLQTKEVTMAHFETALADSRATVTPEMENEYQAMSGRLKQQASAIQPIGFVTPGMLRGHGPKGAD
jgi:transitional endoplasmic reticulum ATPase